MRLSVNSANWSSSDHKCYSEDGEVCDIRGIQGDVTGKLGAKEDVHGKAWVEGNEKMS